MHAARKNLLAPASRVHPGGLRLARAFSEQAAPAAAASPAAPPASAAAFDLPTAGDSFSDRSGDRARRIRGLVVPDLLRIGLSPVSLPHKVRVAEPVSNPGTTHQRDPTFALPLSMSSEQILDKDAVIATGFQRFKEAFNWEGVPYSAKNAMGQTKSKVEQFPSSVIINIARAASSNLDPVAQKRLMAYAYKRALMADLHRFNVDKVTLKAQGLKGALQGANLSLSDARKIISVAQERLSKLATHLAKREVSSRFASGGDAEGSNKRDELMEEMVAQYEADPSVIEAALLSFQQEEKAKKHVDALYASMATLASEVDLDADKTQRLYTLALEAVTSSAEQVRLPFSSSVPFADRGKLNGAVAAVLQSVALGHEDGTDLDDGIAIIEPADLPEDEWADRREKHVAKMLKAPLHDAGSKTTTKPGSVASPWTESARERLGDAGTRAKLVAMLRDKKAAMKELSARAKESDKAARHTRRNVESLLKFAVTKDKLAEVEAAVLEEIRGASADAKKRSELQAKLAQARIFAALRIVKLRLSAGDL